MTMQHCLRRGWRLCMTLRSWTKNFWLSRRCFFIIQGSTSFQESWRLIGVAPWLSKRPTLMVRLILQIKRIRVLSWLIRSASSHSLLFTHQRTRYCIYRILGEYSKLSLLFFHILLHIPSNRGVGIVTLLYLFMVLWKYCSLKIT